MPIFHFMARWLSGKALGLYPMVRARTASTAALRGFDPRPCRCGDRLSLYRLHGPFNVKNRQISQLSVTLDEQPV